MFSPMLWIVATPLGNLGDCSPRAKEVLTQADIILAEDTRRAGILCQNYGITPSKFMSFHDHNEENKIRAVITELQRGKHIALVSDAGMPLIADPGYRLVRACRATSIPVSVIPGPSAPITALAGSGIPPLPFAFLGFLPRDRGEQEKILVPFVDLTLTLIFFERNNRLINTLMTASLLLGRREICIARELTKTHEEFLCGTLLPHAHLIDTNGLPFSVENVLGEVTVVIGPPEKEVMTNREQVIALIAHERKDGGTPRDIARRVQLHTKGWTVKAIYALLSSGESA